MMEFDVLGFAVCVLDFGSFTNVLIGSRISK